MTKIVFSLVIGSLAIIIVCLFWRNPALTSPLLIILAFIKHKKFPLKREFLLFVLSAMWGALAESVAIFAGAWSYTQPQLINIPFWLPFLWGLTGITGITFYEGFNIKTGKNEKVVLN